MKQKIYAAIIGLMLMVFGALVTFITNSEEGCDVKQ